MELLTIDNARDLLKKGEIYRIGANALNVLEFTYEHKGFETKNPNYKKLPPFLKDAETLYLDGKINWLDVDMEEQKTDYRFHALKKPYKTEDIRTSDPRFSEGIFCAWNGEPLWLLEDYETTNDIEDLC
jgi:hypothetical protein